MEKNGMPRLRNKSGGVPWAETLGEKKKKSQRNNKWSGLVRWVVRLSVFCMAVVIVLFPPFLSIEGGNPLSLKDFILPYSPTSFFATDPLSKADFPPDLSTKIAAQADGAGEKYRCVHTPDEHAFCTFPTQEEQQPEYTRQTHFFAKMIENSPPIWLEGWLYQPTTQTAHLPLVVMASGFGAQKDRALDVIAAGLVKTGKAIVFLFDYRTWGGSGGYPRHVADPEKMTDDFALAVEWAAHGGLANNGISASNNSAANNSAPKILPTINDNIFLWGASYAGAHVHVAAHKLRNAAPKTYAKLKGIISFIPYFNRGSATKAFHKRTMVGLLKSGLGVASDFLRGWLCRGSEIHAEPSGGIFCGAVYLPIASLANSYGAGLLRIDSDEFDLWRSRFHTSPPLPTWRNAIAARSALYFLQYQPQEIAIQGNLKTLFFVGDEDKICPPESILPVAEHLNRKFPNLAQVEVLESTNHFSAYVSPARDVVLKQTLDFIQKNA